MTFSHLADQKALLNQVSTAPSSSPPPAYELPLSASANGNHLTMNNFTTYATPNTGSDDGEDTGSDFSPIDFSFSTTINIEGDSNQISLDPGAAAQSIAVAVVGALKDASCNAMGLPMIDENGRPRPVHFKVEAGISVKGQGNRVGKLQVASSSAFAGGVGVGVGQQGRRDVGVGAGTSGGGGGSSGGPTQNQNSSGQVSGTGVQTESKRGAGSVPFPPPQMVPATTTPASPNKRKVEGEEQAERRTQGPLGLGFGFPVDGDSKRVRRE